MFYLNDSNFFPLSGADLMLFLKCMGEYMMPCLKFYFM
jgi:hypothetical protein